jgi:hypothetical protein
MEHPTRKRDVSGPLLEDLINRIDAVLRRNRPTELIILSLTIILFLTGIATLVTALVTRRFLWSTPATLTTTLLYWPLRQLRGMRSENILLAVVPVLLRQLNNVQAAKEIQLLLRHLYGGLDDRPRQR